MSNNKRVIIVGTAHPFRGGLAAFNERLAREYQNSGYSVKIITFSLQYPEFLFPGKTQYSSDPAPEDLEIEIKVNSLNPLTWIKVGHQIKREAPDLLLMKYWLPVMAPALGTIARIARRNKHTKVVTVVDNIIPHEKRPADVPLSNYFVKSVDGYVAMSRSVMNDLQKFDQKRKKEFCPHPLYDHYGELVPRDIAIQKLNLDPGYSYLLFFGFIRDYKGLDILLKAMGDQRIAGKPIKLLVAGEFYTDSKPYYDLIGKLGLEDKVIMANDFIPEGEVKYYFCASRLVVQPYKSATQSGVTQIAYHFNKPMVITNVGGLTEFVPHEKVGFVQEPTPRAVADAVVRFFEEDRETEFIENIKQEKQNYSWQRMLEAIEQTIL
ncbi:MAG: glycosyltransferase [Bacteroidales bacterium]|nr:glycosyltransferase [Bacteroidales bacterium]